MKIPLLCVDRNSELLLQQLNYYIEDQIGFSENYPNFGKLRIDTIHPFAVINLELMEGRDVPQNLFPSLTVSFLNENNHSKEFIGKSTHDFYTKEDFDEYKNLDWEERLISREMLNRLELVYAGKPDNIELSVNVNQSLEQFRLSFTIWASNHQVKDVLYQIAKTFVKSNVDFWVGTMNWNEITWNGDKDGIYNLEFGEILYGAVITINASRPVIDYTIETDYQLIDNGINIVTEGLNDTGDYLSSVVPKVEYNTYNSGEENE